MTDHQSQLLTVGDTASPGSSAPAVAVPRQPPTDDQKLNHTKVGSAPSDQEHPGRLSNLKRPKSEDGGPSCSSSSSPTFLRSRSFSSSSSPSSSSPVLAIDYSQAESSTSTSTKQLKQGTSDLDERTVFRAKRIKTEHRGASPSQDTVVNFLQSLAPSKASTQQSAAAAISISNPSSWSRSALGASSGSSSSSRAGSSYHLTASNQTSGLVSGKLSKKSLRQMIRLNSPSSHTRCLYNPGAYSSFGQLSSQMMRRQCALSYCCHCQNPYLQGRSAAPTTHEASQASSNTSSRSEHPSTSSASSAPFSSIEVTPGPVTVNATSAVAVRQQPGKRPESLLEIAARLVAEHIPFEYIEQRYSCIPEPVQRRIIFWSFPRDESYIRLYSSISSIFKQDSLTGSSANFHLPSLSAVAANQVALSAVSSSGSSTGAVAASSSSSSSSSSADFGSQPGLDTSSSSSLFNSGLLLMFSGAVHQVLQVGFNLSGVVTNAVPYSSISSGSVGSSYFAAHGAASSSAAILDYNPSSFLGPEYSRYNIGSAPYLSSRDASLYSRSKAISSSYLVSITFDRCKITSVTCTCNAREYHLFWCEHVVALALYRIRKPLAIELRVPISESLLEFDREQLQKLLQYLIAEHHVQILPTVQRLVDELSHKRSVINLTAGAPDPTAGACVMGRHDWYLNEEKINTQVRDLVKYVSVNEAKQIIQLFYKIVDMLKIRDSNGPRFLRLITEQFLYSYSHFNKPDEASSSFDPYIFLWDHLINLWIYIVADIGLSPLTRIHWREMFRHWAHQNNCPREDTYFCLEVDTVGDARYSQAEMVTASQAHEYLSKFLDEENASLESLDYLSQRRRTHHATTSAGASTSHISSHSRIRRRRIMERAFDATFLTWDDIHLQMILRDDGPVDKTTHLHFAEYFDRDGFPIWSEHLPTAATRVASLRVNGHNQEALRLAMAVVRYLKHSQHQKLQQYQKHKMFCDFEHAPASESWIGSPLDPIGVLFDTLAEASLTPDSKSLDTCYALVGYDKKMESNNFYGGATAHQSSAQACRTLLTELFQQYNEINMPVDRAAEDALVDRPKYRHVTVPGAVHRSDTYLAGAVTVAIIGLAQHRRAPDLDSQRDKTYRQEARMLRKLLDIKLDSTLLGVLQKQASLLLEIGILGDIVVGEYCTKQVPYDIAQIPGLVRYLFGALFPAEPMLAYEIGLQSLRYFSMKDEVRVSRNDNERYSKFHRGIQFYYMDMQLMLAKTMLFAARNDREQLEKIFNTIKNNVNSAIYLNRLAHDVFQFSLNGTRHEHLLSIAYAFGLHLTKITLSESQNDSPRKPIIQWLVSCASEISLESILHLMHNWQEFFTPSEAVRQVATTVLSPNFNVRICNHIFRQDELALSARKLAVECAVKDPASCALNALSLCEKDQIAFDTISKVVEKAGAMCHMNAHQLFTVARYMEHQGVSDRACKIALLAASQVNIPLSADTHHLIGDLQWACSLAQSLGTGELTELINILVKNVRCAPVLADMIRRCTFPPQPIHPSKHMMLHSTLRHSNFVPDTGNLAYMEHLTVEERMRRRGAFKTYPLDRQPLSTLLNAAVRAYIETVMKRLEHISPRHYSDFIEFLKRAQETIILAPDGLKEFTALLENIKISYKGKKKLMSLVRDNFKS